MCSTEHFKKKYEKLVPCLQQCTNQPNINKTQVRILLQLTTNAYENIFFTHFHISLSYS